MLITVIVLQNRVDKATSRSPSSIKEKLLDPWRDTSGVSSFGRDPKLINLLHFPFDVPFDRLPSVNFQVRACHGLSRLLNLLERDAAPVSPDPPCHRVLVPPPSSRTWFGERRLYLVSLIERNSLQGFLGRET